MDQVLHQLNVSVSAYSLAPCWDEELPYYGVFLEHADMASFDTGLAEPGVDVAFPVSSEVCVRINRSDAVARREVSEDVVD